MDSLFHELTARGFRCWYDNRMSNLTKQGMADGVRFSAVFVLFLSQEVLTRPFVRFEVGEALKNKKGILLLHESDGRHQPFNFATEVEQAPGWLQEVVANHESLPWRRRGFERDAIIDQLVARANLVAPTGEGQQEKEEEKEAAAPPPSVPIGASLPLSLIHI